MEIGRFQRVVQYRVVQKMTWLAVEPLPSQSANHYFVNFGLTNLKTTRKSARQSSETGDYLVMKRSLP